MHAGVIFGLTVTLTDWPIRITVFRKNTQDSSKPVSLSCARRSSNEKQARHPRTGRVVAESIEGLCLLSLGVTTTSTNNFTIILVTAKLEQLSSPFLSDNSPIRHE